LPTVLAINPDAPRALIGRSLLSDHLAVEIASDAEAFLSRAEAEVFDLLVLGGLDVNEQQEIVLAFQAHRRWRLVPVLYLSDPQTPGLAIPGTFRPEMDGLARGTLESLNVQRRITELARDGIGAADLVVAGPFELDPVRGKLRLPELEVAFTDRESEILAILLARPNRTVLATEIIERGWGTDADARYLQILRRHVSNIRRKLQRTIAARSVRTVRGSGYRFDVKQASL
jgi:DNA-binding response OmpR family regulator